MRKLNQKVWPYQTTVRADSREAGADEWCNERFGRRFQGWYGYTITPQYRIYAFKDEASLLVFKLAWGYR